MPFKIGNTRNIQIDVVPRFEGKVWRPLDDQVDHLGGQDHPCHHIGLALLRPRLAEAE